MSYLACDACGLSVRVRAPAYDLDRCPRCGDVAVLVAGPPPRPRRRSTVTPIRSAVTLSRADAAGSPPRMHPA